jgi:hypothetical protein
MSYKKNAIDWANFMQEILKPLNFLVLSKWFPVYQPIYRAR